MAGKMSLHFPGSLKSRTERKFELEEFRNKRRSGTANFRDTSTRSSTVQAESVNEEKIPQYYKLEQNGNISSRSPT